MENLETALCRFKERLKSVIGEDSIRGFAKGLEISEGALRNYLGGKTYPDLKLLTRISTVSGCDFIWLVSGESPNNNKKPTKKVDSVEKAEMFIDAIETMGESIISDKLDADDKETHQIYSRLKEIALNSSFDSELTAKADRYLSILFLDGAANQRIAERTSHVKFRVREARQIYEQAVIATGFKPNEMLGESLKSAIYEGNLTLELTVILLDSIKSQVKD